MDDDFFDKIVKEHNKRRAMHGCGELRLSAELSKKAQSWAERVARQGHISYCEQIGVGENITFFPRHLRTKDIVEYWYEEHVKYEYETPGWQAGTNYFTQVVWKATTEIGLGRAFVEDDVEIPESNYPIPRRNSKIAEIGDQVLVAFYRPGGNSNRNGYFAVNVPKPINNGNTIIEEEPCSDS